MFYLNMILLAFVVAFVIDLSGFVQTVKPHVNTALKRDPDASLKPFDCSMCMCFWAGIVLCAFQGFTFPHVAFACLCSYCLRFLNETVFIVEEALSALISKLSNLVAKLW